MCIAFPATTGFSVAMDSTLHLWEVKITNTSSRPPVPPPLGVLVHSLLDVCVSKCMLCCSVVSDSGHSLEHGAMHLDHVFEGGDC